MSAEPARSLSSKSFTGASLVEVQTAVADSVAEAVRQAWPSGQVVVDVHLTVHGTVPASRGDKPLPVDAAVAEPVIRRLVSYVGVGPHLVGYKYLVAAVGLVAARWPENLHMTKELYPDVAAMHRTSPSRVERAMRHALVYAGKSCPKAFTEVFGEAFRPGWSEARVTNTAAVFALVYRLGDVLAGRKPLPEEPRLG